MKTSQKRKIKNFPTKSSLSFHINSIVLLKKIKKKFATLETFYETKLQIQEPVIFMKKQAESYQHSFWFWSIFSIFIGCILLFLLSILLSPSIRYQDKIITITLLSEQVSIYTSMILLAMVSLVLYLLRLFIRIATSSKHLSEEYKQKYALTYFYLSLYHNGNIPCKESQNIILASLFTKADTGLLKKDSSKDMEKTMLSLFNIR